MLKKIINSRLLRISISLILIYFAFRKVDVPSLWRQLITMDWWFVVFTMFLSLLGIGLVSWRWSMLLLKKPKFNDVKVFNKSSLVGSFYSLFFPTSVAGDLLKWMIVDEKYPELSKSRLLGSVVLDRFIGMSVFVLAGFVMLLLGDFDDNMIPFWVWLVFIGLFLGCLVFFVGVCFFDLSKSKLWQFKFLKKFKDVAELVNKENRKQIFKAVGISLVSEILWICQMWFVSWYFGTGLTIVSIFVFLPIIAMILSLPISFAGFGAREQLYVLFFGALATSTESLLLASAYSGIIGIIIALIGGLVSLNPDFKKSRGIGVK